MTPRPFTWIMSALLLFVGWGESRAQETGLLLGLQYAESIAQPLPYYAGDADSLSRAVYRTLLISESEGAFVVWSDENDLLIPGADGFWHAGAKRSVYNNWVEDFIWAASDGAPRALMGIQPYNGEYCKGHRKQTILYAGPQYLSLDQQSAGYCEGAAHPWFFNTLAVVPLDSTTHTGLPITEVLGEAAHEALVASAKLFLDAIEDDERRAAYSEEPDDANWALVRRKGRWTILGRLEAADAANHGAFADLPLSFDVPATFTGHAQPATPWKSIEAFAPDAVDAFVAPEEDWLVILHPDQLAVYPVASGAIGQAVVTVPVAPGAHAVMVRWATDAPLRGWIEYFEGRAQSRGS